MAIGVAAVVLATQPGISARGADGSGRDRLDARRRSSPSNTCCGSRSRRGRTGRTMTSRGSRAGIGRRISAASSISLARCRWLSCWRACRSRRRSSSARSGCFKLVPYAHGLDLLGPGAAQRAPDAAGPASRLRHGAGAGGDARLRGSRATRSPRRSAASRARCGGRSRTLTTVGYGDEVPVTALGRLLAGGVMLCGIGICALWTAILVTGFSHEMRRSEFLRTWDLVARVPYLPRPGRGEHRRGGAAAAPARLQRRRGHRPPRPARRLHVLHRLGRGRRSS